MLKDMQFNSLYIARKFVEGLEQEITRQQVIIWDPNASPVQVEEAIYALPLLHELLDKRRHQLSELQEEFFGEARAD